MRLGADYKKTESHKHEEHVAKAFRGRRQPNSGATPFRKGDVESKEFLVECKETAKKSISVTTKWLDKISKQAMLVGREPSLTLRFSSAPLGSRDWVLVPERVFKELKDGNSRYLGRST